MDLSRQTKGVKGKNACGKIDYCQLLDSTLGPRRGNALRRHPAVEVLPCRHSQGQLSSAVAIKIRNRRNPRTIPERGISAVQIFSRCRLT
jgi:hypothetical protein